MDWFHSSMMPTKWSMAKHFVSLFRVIFAFERFVYFYCDPCFKFPNRRKSWRPSWDSAHLIHIMCSAYRWTASTDFPIQIISFPIGMEAKAKHNLTKQNMAQTRRSDMSWICMTLTGSHCTTPRSNCHMKSRSNAYLFSKQSQEPLAYPSPFGNKHLHWFP